MCDIPECLKKDYWCVQGVFCRCRCDVHFANDHMLFETVSLLEEHYCEIRAYFYNETG